MFFFFSLDIYFSTKKSGKSLWNFKIQIICNVVLFFSLCYGISNSGQPLYLTFCYLCNLSFTLRYCANSHGISTFREFAI